WPDNRIGNPLATEMWTRWLNAGHRITAIGGSDYHRPVNKAGDNKPPDRLGSPRTYVYAKEISGAAILDGLRRRQVYVSMGAQVEFSARHNDISYTIGADLGVQNGTVVLTGQVAACGHGVARLLANGKIVQEILLYGDPATLTANVDLDP